MSPPRKILHLRIESGVNANPNGKKPPRGPFWAHVPWDHILQGAPVPKSGEKDRAYFKHRIGPILHRHVPPEAVQHTLYGILHAHTVWDVRTTFAPGEEEILEAAGKALVSELEHVASYKVSSLKQ